MLKRIPTLDGWRGLAVILVTFHHAAESLFTRDDILQYTRWGASGVDLFFALSGILITRLLLDEQQRFGGIDLKAFYIRRLFRVTLPCYCYLLLIWCRSLFESRTELLSSIFFFRNYLPAGSGTRYTIHLWSLAVEEHFYLLWPLLLVVGTVQYGQRIAAWGAVLCAAWRVAALNSIHFGPASPPTLFRTDFRLDCLLWGCAFAFVLDKPANWKRVAAPVLVYLMVVGPMSLKPVLLPALLVFTALNPGRIVAGILDSRPLVWFGKISYSLYLWQMLFFVPPAAHLVWFQQFPINVAAAIGMAALCYRIIDLPLLRLGHKLSAAHRPTRVEPALQCA